MIRVRFYIGEADLGPALWSVHVERARAIAAVLTLHGVQGATILPGFGLWEGRLEASTVVEVLGLGPGKARAIAAALRSAFDQDTVMYTEEYATPDRGYGPCASVRYSDRSGVDHA